MAWTARPGFPAFLIGAVIFADAAIGRMLLRADEEWVYVLGRPVMWMCSFRRQWGVPCPTCGMTRSVVLSLHGHFAEAWQMAPGGVAAVVGALGLAVALWTLALLQLRSDRLWETAMQTGIRRWAPVYGAVATVVWLVGWVVQFRAALEMR